MQEALQLCAHTHTPDSQSHSRDRSRVQCGRQQCGRAHLRADDGRWDPKPEGDQAPDDHTHQELWEERGSKLRARSVEVHSSCSTHCTHHYQTHSVLPVGPVGSHDGDDHGNRAQDVQGDEGDGATFELQAEQRSVGVFSAFCLVKQAAALTCPPPWLLIRMWDSSVRPRMTPPTTWKAKHTHQHGRESARREGPEMDQKPQRPAPMPRDRLVITCGLARRQGKQNKLGFMTTMTSYSHGSSVF